MLNKATLNLLTDCLAFFFSIGMLLTGFIIWWPLPPGTNKDRQLWGLSRHDWGEIHLWMSYALIVVLLIHISLHWKWILAMIRKRYPSEQISDRQWTVAIVVALLIFFSVFFTAAAMQVKKIPDTCALNYIENIFVQSALAQQQESVGVKLLNDKCISCHGLEKTSAGVDLKNKSGLGNGEDPLIVRFKSGESRLIRFLENLPSDLKRRDKHILSSKEIQDLKDWIDSGGV